MTGMVIIDDYEKDEPARVEAMRRGLAIMHRYRMTSLIDGEVFLMAKEGLGIEEIIERRVGQILYERREIIDPDRVARIED